MWFSVLRKRFCLLLLPAIFALAACGESDRDETAPLITLTTALQTVTPRADTSVSLAGTIDEGATLEVRLNDQLVDGMTVSGGSWSGTIDGLREGTNQIALTAVDAAGNTNTIDIVIVVTDGPIVVSPVSGSVDLPRAAVTIVFNEALDPTTVNATNLFLTGPAGAAVTGTLDYAAGATSVSFVPDVELSPATAYTLSVGTGLTDEAGNPAVAQSIAFTTLP